MFYNKKIKALEERLNEVTARVNELEDAVHNLTVNVVDFATKTDALWQLSNLKKEAAPAVLASKPKPRRRPKKNNGKETPKTTE